MISCRALAACAFAMLFAECAFSGDRGPRLLENSVRTETTLETTSLRVDVGLVLVPVTVTDRRGQTITGLRRDQFQIFEDAVPQEIVSLSEDDVPTSIGIVFDLSGSMLPKVNKARDAVRVFLSAVNPEDELMLVTLADQARVAVEFTSSASEIETALQAARPGGSTALNDAICLALHRMKSAHRRRRALLIISDGGENESRYSEKELRALALESDVQVHAIGIHDHAQTKEEMRGPFLLESLTELTGGQHVTVRFPSDLASAAAKIGTAMREQYVLGYYMPINTPEGTWHRIRVKVAVPLGRPAMQVRSRSGYFSPVR